LIGRPWSLGQLFWKDIDPFSQKNPLGDMGMPGRGTRMQESNAYRLTEKDIGVIGFVRKCEFVLYSKQMLDSRSWVLD
jgi:hypothetical protein